MTGSLTRRDPAKDPLDRHAAYRALLLWTSKPIAPANLPRTLDDADVAVINGNYAIEAHLAPAKDALLLESAKDNPTSGSWGCRRCRWGSRRSPRPA